MVHCMHPTKRSRRRSRNRRQVKLPRHECRGSVRAATPQQNLKPRTNSKNFSRPAAWMRRRPRNPSTIQRMFANALTIPSAFTNLPDNSSPPPRNRRQVKLPRQEAAGALVFANGGSLQDAGGFPRPAARRAAITKPIPRRNFHRGAGRIAGGSERRRTDEGRAAGGGDAATKPQAAHQPKELLKTSRMDAATAPQPIDHPTHVRERPDNPKRIHEPPRQQQSPAAQPPAGQAPAAGRRGSVGVCEWREPAGCRRISKARGPEGRHNQAHPTPELPKASRQDCRRV